MGVIRVLLALGVVRDHRPFFDYFFLVKGGFAVILFYIISGFYMSLVIKESYSKLGDKWQLKFLLSRALRLFPAYWVVLIFTIIVMPALGTPTVYTNSLGLDPFHRAMTLFSDTFILGLDVLVSGGTLHWNPGGAMGLSWQLFPIFVGWTLAVEITFYVLAAYFIVTSRKVAAFALTIGLYLRFWFFLVNGKDLGLSATGLGYSNTPWGYHFFGIALVFFMFGYVAYEIYVKLRERVASDPKFIWKVRGATIVLCAILLGEAALFGGYQTIADYNDYRIWATIPFFVALIPPLFLLTKRSAFDNFLGLYSYPIYLCHVISTDFAVRFLGAPKDSILATCVGVALVSTVLVFAVERPSDRFRHWITSRQSLKTQPGTIS